MTPSTRDDQGTDPMVCTIRIRPKTVRIDRPRAVEAPVAEPARDKAAILRAFAHSGLLEPRQRFQAIQLGKKLKATYEDG